MNRSPIDIEESIAHKAEFELWQSIRDDTRGQLTRAITIGFLYLLAALAVGSYLILAVAEVGEGALFWYGWQTEELEVEWMAQLALGYGGLAVIASIVYVLTLLLVHGMLPSTLCQIVGSVPWIGSTMRIIAIGEFCQSIYQSVLRQQTYADAFTQASQAVRNTALRRWSSHSSHRIESGHSLANVLQSSPIKDQPLSAVAAFVTRELSADESIRIWHRATAECHLLAQSRFDRAMTGISVTCLLVSVLIATFAMLLSGMFMKMTLEGTAY